MDFVYYATSAFICELFSLLYRRFIYISISVGLFLILASSKLFAYLTSLYSLSTGILFTWFEGLHYYFLLATMFDSSILITLTVIAGVSSTIILFSCTYMLGDTRLYEFLALLVIFVSSMLMLVSASSFMWFVSFWEAIGVCSFCLISFWTMRIYAIRASLQAMLVNKVGDACMLVTLVIYCSLMNGEDMSLWIVNWSHFTWVAFVILLAACSKSALGFFHYWLPYAMEGPTSVSALIHAATLVTAGLFLVIKIKFLLLSGVVCFLMLILSFIGVLLLALIAADQFDVKRLIAYSTLSQIAYMFATIALGAFNVSIVYILVHALFKSLMFMTAGAIIHGIYDQQDMRSVSSLAKVMPVALFFCIAACMCMLGITASMGMYSKELIVEVFGNTFRLEGWWLGQCLLIGLAATTLYSAIMIWSMFSGGYKSMLLPRSADEIGIYTLVILVMQAIALLTTGDYLSTSITTDAHTAFAPFDASISLTDTVLSLTSYNDYSYAVIVLSSIFILRSDVSRLVSLRLHAFKWFYDRVLNSYVLLLHELLLSVRSDILRAMFFLRYSIANTVALSWVRPNFSRVLVWLIIVLVILL